MKRSFISILAVAGILISGCALEEVPSKEGVIRAIMENDETRTSVTDEGKFTWSAGDKIWLGTTSGSVIGTLASGAGTSSANFSYGSFFGEMTGKAVYPYNSGHSVKGDVLDMVLPASYDLGTSLQNTNAALYGVNVDGTLKFNHLAGVMRFKFKNVPAGVNQFVITLDKKINGTFKADLTADYPVLETSATEVEAEKTVTFNFDALTQPSDIMIYVPLPLGTYNSLGLALNNAEESVWTYSNTVTNTIKRKKLILMPTVTLSGSIDGDLEGDGSEEEPMPEPQEGDYVDEYGINHGQGIKIGEIVWAPVNCGYHKTDYPWGKLYQWGRKYGQGYSLYYDATVPEIVVGPVKISQASDPSNSNVFYSNRTPPFNWASDFDDGLWNSGTESSPVKTDYDPCPEGWRVPTFNELADLSYNYSSWASNSSSQNGYYFSGEYTYLEDAPQVFLPAAGDCDYHSGETGLRDSNGNYWSSRPNGIDAYCLYFNDSSVAMNYRYRSNGYSVRCVKEGAASPAPSEPEIINLSENGTANSYIVSEAGSYKIIPTKGNSNESVGTISSVEVLWESLGPGDTQKGDLIKSVSYDGKIAFQTADTFKEGNAVIAVKDASGNILWSWHIWFTDEPQGQEYYNNAGTMMDRDLGAYAPVSNGLLYQWGRKDPFLGGIYAVTEDKSTITWPSAVRSDASNGTIEYATANPTTFITCNQSNYDWYYTGDSSTDNTRWTESNSVKSIYDPCPAGWRVPDGGADGVWSKALGSPSEFNYEIYLYYYNFAGKLGSDTNILYPVSHFIDAEGNRVNNSHSECWSASSYYNEASTLGILPNPGRNNVYPSSYRNRAFGLSVRCIKE